MTEENIKLADNLYGLRAGLSVLSEETDAIRAIEDNYWKDEKTMIDEVPRRLRDQSHSGESDIAYEVWNLYEDNSLVVKKISKDYNFDVKKFNDNEEKYWNCNPTEAMEQRRNDDLHTLDKIYERWLLSDEAESQLINTCAAMQQEELKKMEEKYKKSSSGFFIKRTIYLILSALLLGAAVGLYFYFEAKITSNILRYCIWGGGGLLAIWFLISFIKFFIVAIRCIIYSAYQRKGRKEINKLKKDAERPENSDKAVSVRYARMRLKEYVDKKEKELYPCLVRSDALYKALQKEYSSVLDERNWKNIDLILFAFETGRADNLKEALAFADQESRTRRIEKAIQNATNQICSTIRSEVSSLRNTVQTCCNRLSAQIQNIGDKVLASNRAILSAQEAMLTEQRMTNALIEKSNMSSMQLMDDIHRLRSNSDYLNLRLRLG